MRSVFLVLAVALSGCPATQPQAPTLQASALPADWFRGDNPELNKFHKAKVNPAIGEAQVKAAVQSKLQGSTTNELKVELKDAQWAKDNLNYEQQLYTLDSPVWVVWATGDIAPPDEGAPRYKSGTFVVDVEFGRVISTILKP